MTMPNPSQDLAAVASAIRLLNQSLIELSGLIQRPAQLGHTGEFIASHVFDIELHDSATHRGSDGIFRAGSALGGRSVNVKWYPGRENQLDLRESSLADDILVLAGPLRPAASSRGSMRPWVIDQVFLFDYGEICARISNRGAKISDAASVRAEEWDEAEIYPLANNPRLVLTDQQKMLLALFSSAALMPFERS